MKKSLLYFSLFLLFLYSCNRNSASSDANTSAATDSTTQCYESSTGTDSASMVLKYQYGRIDGSLSLNFAEKDDMTGKITGNFKGDTLYVDYTFQTGENKEYFKNPLVFLRKDGKLHQGYGEIISSFGRTHFKDGAAIDFEKGFVFEVGECP